MADQGQAESTGTKIRKSRDGEPLDPTTATQNPLKKKLDALGGSQDQDSLADQSAKQPVVRGDGTVLPERTEDQPRNPMKRMMDTSQENTQKEL